MAHFANRAVRPITPPSPLSTRERENGVHHLPPRRPINEPVHSIRRIIHRLRAPTLRRSVGAPAIDLADLLGRPAINLDTPELQRFLAGKRVLITGAGGSIGSEICRQ